MKWGKWKKNLEMIKTEMKGLIYSLKFICKSLFLLAHECCSPDRFVTFWRVCSIFLIIIQIVLRTLFFVHKSIQSFVDPQEIFKIFKPSLIKIIIIIAVFVSIFFSGSIILTCWLLLTYVDVSVLYHTVRGQSVIKLYVIYNMLEVICPPKSRQNYNLIHSVLKNQSSKETLVQLSITLTQVKWKWKFYLSIEMA